MKNLAVTIDTTAISCRLKIPVLRHCSNSASTQAKPYQRLRSRCSKQSAVEVERLNHFAQGHGVGQVFTFDISALASVSSNSPFASRSPRSRS
jgi:hypothetical protein